MTCFSFVIAVKKLIKMSIAKQTSMKVSKIDHSSSSFSPKKLILNGVIRPIATIKEKIKRSQIILHQSSGYIGFIN